MNVENQTVEQQEKIGMTDGDDRNELQPSCMRCKTRQQIIDGMTVDFWGKEIPTNAKELAEMLYELGYRK